MRPGVDHFMGNFALVAAFITLDRHPPFGGRPGFWKIALPNIRGSFDFHDAVVDDFGTLVVVGT